MNVKTLLTGIVAFAAMTQVASAFPGTGDFRSNVGNSPPYSWGTAGNWERYDGSAWQTATNPPNQDNFVTIQAGDEITVDAAASADHIDVNGNLLISGATLTLDGSTSARSSVSSGSAITLVNSSSVLAITTTDHLFTGAGSITGQNASAQIQIASGKKLTSQLTIQGKLTVQAASGTAMFSNKRGNVAGDEGVVVANASGVLKFASSVKFADSAFDSSHRPLYKTDGSAAILQFERLSDGSDADHPRLEGRFQMVNCGTLKALASTETCGPLVASPAGYIDVDTNAGVCFVFDACGGSPVSYCDNTTLGSCP